MGHTTHTSHPTNSNTPPPPSQSSRGLSAHDWFGIPNPAQDTPLPPGSTTLPDNTAQHDDLGGPLGPTSSPLNPPSRSANDGLIGGQHWSGGIYAEHSSSSDADGDNDDPAMDTSNHTAQDPLSSDPPTAPATKDPPLSTAELLQSAIEAARKAAKEESDKTIAELTARNQQATQLLRDELQAQQLKFQQDLLAHADATAQARTEELKRTMETRDQEQAKATQLLHQNLIAHQEQIRAEDIRERLKEQAIQQDRQAKSDAIMESLAAFLSHTNVTARNQISDTTPTTSSTRPTQSSTANIHGHDHQWFSDPSDLPAHWIHQQQEYREHAHAIMISSTPPLLVHNFLQEFQAIRHRPPRLDDLPVWRVLELAPNPTTINFSRTYLPALLSLVLRLAQLNHPPIHNDPLWPNTLTTQATHHDHWSVLCNQLLNEQDPTGQQFRARFNAIHRRPLLEADIPTWQRLVHTENILVSRPLTRDEYNMAAQRHMLRTLTHVDNVPLDPESRSSSPEAYTPLSSPPRPTASAPSAEGTLTQLRTSVTTSPTSLRSDEAGPRVTKPLPNRPKRNS